MPSDWIDPATATKLWLIFPWGEIKPCYTHMEGDGLSVFIYHPHGGYWGTGRPHELRSNRGDAIGVALTHLAPHVTKLRNGDANRTCWRLVNHAVASFFAPP